MSGSFAADTKVPVAKSRAEIETMLTRYGATSFSSGWDRLGAVVLFEAAGRRLRFDLPLPDENDKRFATLVRRGYRQPTTATKRKELCEAEHRRRWRALALVIKAKLEAVASGITSFEAEFLSHVVVPGGSTFGEWATPLIAEAYEKGAVAPPMLGSGQ
jgi:hypothetical protein